METALPLSFSHFSHLHTIPNICSSLLCFYLQSRYEGIQNLKDQIMKLNPDIMCMAYLLDLKSYYRLLINSCIWMNVFWDWETICFSQLPSGSWSKTWKKLKSIQINYSLTFVLIKNKWFESLTIIFHISDQWER